jgi:hypothetical protein
MMLTRPTVIPTPRPIFALPERLSVLWEGVAGDVDVDVETLVGEIEVVLVVEAGTVYIVITDTADADEENCVVTEDAI